MQSKKNNGSSCCLFEETRLTFSHIRVYENVIARPCTLALDSTTVPDYKGMVNVSSSSKAKPDEAVRLYKMHFAGADSVSHHSWVCFLSVSRPNSINL